MAMMYRSRQGHDSIVSEAFNRIAHEQGVQVAVQPPLPTNEYKTCLAILNLNEKNYVTVEYGGKTIRIMPGEKSLISLLDSDSLEDVVINRINGGIDE